MKADSTLHHPHAGSTLLPDVSVAVTTVFACGVRSAVNEAPAFARVDQGAGRVGAGAFAGVQA